MIRVKEPWEREDCMSGAQKLTQKAIEDRKKKSLNQNKENEAMAKDVAHFMVSKARERVITY